MKKGIALLLTAALSVTLLAGCGGDDGSSAPESKTNNQGSAQESKDNTSASDEGQGSQGGAENSR